MAQRTLMLLNLSQDTSLTWVVYELRTVRLMRILGMRRMSHIQLSPSQKQTAKHRLPKYNLLVDARSEDKSMSK